MNISGSGSLPGGDYNEPIRISGSGKINGSVSCSDLSISGSGHVYGDLRCREGFRVSGSGRVDGNISSGDITVSGSCHIGGDAQADSCSVSGSLHTGSVRCNGLHISGALTAVQDVTAENAVVRGAIHSGGLINADKLDVEFSGSCDADSIGGSNLRIKKSGIVFNFFSKLFHRDAYCFTVKNSIEGDTVHLEHVVADTVVGRDVVIGDGCRIRHVIYRDHIDISENASVELYEASAVG